MAFWGIVTFLLTIITQIGVEGQYEWQAKDAFDEIRIKLDKVNGGNCRIQHVENLVLPDDSVSHLPDIKDINVNPVFPNRTALVHLHNLALSRSFFFSYILQARFIRPAINDTYDPGMMYYFLSTVADVSSNPYINGSAIYFSPNMSYSSSYRGFFNKTFPRFAPRTFRADDFNDPIHLERISTLNTFSTMDLGAIPTDRYSDDYTNELYHSRNDWYRAWLPDTAAEKRHDTKTTYHVEIRYANNTNETFTFHGPPGADENPGPVKWTRPYYDCKRSDKWLVAAVAPVADIYPRHTGFRHIEYPTYTAAVVLELDFERIDINQCPKTKGNDGKNRFVDTARCKKETTECEPLHGWGFRRGGYQCRCNPGYRLPNVVRRPFLGEIIERASNEEYYNGFDCLKIGWIHKTPVIWEKASKVVREKYLQQHYEYKNYTPGPGSVHDTHKNIDEVLRFIHKVNENTCKQYTAEQLQLTGDYGFGAREFFSNQARMAARLANFISAFLQISDPTEVYSEKRVADKPLTEDQMIAETLSLVLGDFKIFSAGTYWDTNKFTNRTLFAPYAYKLTNTKTFKVSDDAATRNFKVEDLARITAPNDVYTNKKFFKGLKQRWSTNFDNLEKYFIKMRVRYNESGEHLKKYEHFPTYYKAANLNHGYWSDPYFDCDGHVKKWLISYSSPFFGYDSLKNKLEFKGVVTVTMDLLALDINQCPDKYYVPNAFRATDKCDRKTSYCVPILGRGYYTGGYKCECLQGYEYPYEDPITYFDGQLMEAEFSNIVADTQTRFDMFQCRIAGAASVYSSTILLVMALAMVWLRIRV